MAKLEHARALRLNELGEELTDKQHRLADLHFRLENLWGKDALAWSEEVSFLECHLAAISDEIAMLSSDINS